MDTLAIVLLVIVLGLLAAFAGLYFFTQRMEKKQNAQRTQMEQMSQVISMLVIDKRRLRIKDSGLPQAVIDQTPKYLRRSKVAVVKAKVGPKVTVMMCDEEVFDILPVKKEVRAVVSGIYISAVKGLRGSLEVPEKKKGFFARMKQKALASRRS